MTTLSFLIKRKYLAEKLKEQQETGVFIERRAYTPFWRKRIGSMAAWNRGGNAVFLCGKDAFRAAVRRITIEKTPAGIDDAVPSEMCYCVECQFETLGFVKVFVEG